MPRTLRVAETAGGTTRHFYYSSGWQVLEERLDSSTDAERQFVWGDRYIDDLVLRDRDTSTPKNGTLDERLYALQDANFNVVALAGTDGTIQERYIYPGPFGQDSVRTPTFGFRGTSSFDWEYRYTGRRRDAATGLYDYRNRPYHASLGRFTSRDPIDYWAGDPNLYAYLFNDPASATDPMGLRKIRGTRGRGQLFNDLMAEQAGHRPQYRPIERTIDQMHAMLDVRYDKALAQGALNVGEAIPNAAIGVANEAAEQAAGGLCPGVGAVARQVVDYFSESGQQGLVPDIPRLNWAENLVFQEDHAWHESGAWIAENSWLLLAGVGAEKLLAGGGGALGWADDLFRGGGGGGSASGFSTWNEFQAGTAGQFSSRGEAGKAWQAYKQANDIVSGTSRSAGARCEYLKSLSDDYRTVSWMKSWLETGKVPPGYEVDHIKPRSVGGSDTATNMRLQGTDLHRLWHKFYRPWDW